MLLLNGIPIQLSELYVVTNRRNDNLKQFNEGDVVYFISSSVFIKKATVIRNAGGFCTIRFSDGNCGTSGTRVRESKLYRTEEEAKKVVQQHQNANKWR